MRLEVNEIFETRNLFWQDFLLEEQPIVSGLESHCLSYRSPSLTTLRIMISVVGGRVSLLKVKVFVFRDRAL